MIYFLLIFLDLFSFDFDAYLPDVLNFEIFEVVSLISRRFEGTSEVIECRAN